MRLKLLERLLGKEQDVRKTDAGSWVRALTTGSFYRLAKDDHSTTLKQIESKVNAMRVLAEDSQVSVALNYYATDATTKNSNGQIIWAVGKTPKDEEIAHVINDLFERWEINKYARDHILELATVGNLYIPTTYFYNQPSTTQHSIGVALDNNSIPDLNFDIIPSTIVQPDEILHLWHRGERKGFIVHNGDTTNDIIVLPESGCVHFSLGGLMGEHYLDTKTKDGEEIRYDIQFAEPLMTNAVQPTQTLNMLENAIMLSSLARTIKFINVRSGEDEETIMTNLIEMKNKIEQQLSLDTNVGDAQSYVNPQSPNNLVYLPYVDGAEAVSVTDLNMADSNSADSELLEYQRDKKLSVLGVPKEAMNFSSNEGLGGAGSVLSQRSAIYANALERLETAYTEGWKDALNKYFIANGLSGYVNRFVLHMTPIITTQSTIKSEKKDSALSQAQSMIDILKNLGVTDSEEYTKAITEILSEEFPGVSADSINWDINVTDEEDGGVGAF